MEKNHLVLPYSLFNSMDHMNNLMNELFSNKSIFSNYPPTDLYFKDNKFYLDIIVAGFEKEDINIEIENNILSVTARKETKNESEEIHYFSKTISYKNINRSIKFEKEIETVNPSLKNGLLSLEIVLKENLQKKQIKIKGEDNE